MNPSISYVIDSAANLVRIHISGHLQLHHVLQHIAELRADPEFRPGLNQLLDLQGVTNYDINARDLREMAATAIDTESQLQVNKAALVSDQDFVYGMLRMYQAFTEQAAVKVKIFREIEEAEQWLLFD